jgi:hypothetical protein
LLLCTAAHARDKVVVLDLTARDFDETSALQKRVDVLPRAIFYERLAQNDFVAGDCVDEDCMAALGRAAKVQWVVAGSIGRRGDNLRLEARLYRVSQRHLFSSAHRDADDLQLLHKREVKKLAAALWPSEEGSGMPWWLLLLGGGGAAAYFSLSSGGDEDGSGAGGNGSSDDALGAAEIVGSFAD